MRTLFLISVLLLTTKSFAQRNLIFTELGGNAGGISINYERQITKIPMLGLRVGYGKFYQEFATSIPVSIHYLYHIKNQNFVEVGLGYTWLAPRTYDPCPGLYINFYSDSRCNTVERNADHKLFSTIGFRRHFGKEKRFMIKGILTAQLKSTYDNKVIPSAGFAFGYRF